MDKDGLVVNGNGAVCWDSDPVVTLKSQRLAGNKDNVGASVTALHGVVALFGRRTTLFVPAGARAKEQTGSFIRLAADVASADDALAIGDGKVEQTARVAFSNVLRQLSDVAVYALDGPEDGLAQDAMTEAVCLSIRVVGVIA